MPTSTQKNFTKKMKKIDRQIKKGKPEEYYSYINDQYISSYYSSSENVLNRYVQILKVIKNILMFVIIIFGVIVFVGLPYKKMAALPFTLILLSILLLLFGLIQPSLAFLRGKKRSKVLLLYGLTIIICEITGEIYYASGIIQ